MKRFLSLLAAALALVGLTACGASPSAPPSETISVVATIFPIYDWVTQLSRDAGEADVTLLLDTGVDMHSFQPSAADMVLLSSCDLFIYVGGESDAWVEDALAEAKNPDMVVLDLMDILGDRAVKEETVEGMTALPEDDPAPDEHVWLSVQNARLFCSSIAEALSSLDPAHAETYAANARAYDASLAALDDKYRSAVANASYDTLLFGDRFPFRYLCEDYGLTYYAAFPGCSAETEASFETVAFLAAKLDELRLPAVLIIDGSDGRIAETVIQSSQSRSASVLTLDSMQSVTAQDIAAGTSYLTLMENDLAVLTRALNG